MARIKNLVLEDVRVISKNFRGIAKPPYEEAGKPNFCVILPRDPDFIADVAAMGYPVKVFKAPPKDDPDADPDSFIKVSLSFPVNRETGQPYNWPEVYLVTNRGREDMQVVQLDKDSMGTLDTVSIESWDMEIRGWEYDQFGRKGVKAFLVKLYATASDSYNEMLRNSSRLDSKYRKMMDEIDNDDPDLPF